MAEVDAGNLHTLCLGFLCDGRNDGKKFKGLCIGRTEDIEALQDERDVTYRYIYLSPTGIDTEHMSSALTNQLKHL